MRVRLLQNRKPSTPRPQTLVSVSRGDPRRPAEAEERGRFATATAIDPALLRATTPLEDLVYVLLASLRWLWRLGPATLMGIGLLALLVWLASVGDVMTFWVGAFAGLALALLLAARAPRFESARKLAGALITLFAPAVIVVAVYWRATGPGFFWSVMTALGALLVGLLQVLLALHPWLLREIIGRVSAWPVTQDARRVRRVRQFAEELGEPTRPVQRIPAHLVFDWIGGMLAPLLLAWIAISTLHLVVDVVPGFVSLRFLPGHRAVHEAWAAERSGRAQPAAASAGGLAVTLSGGGYRAALTHAGVLWMLDRAGLPVRVLSTVSGGSIVGAAYAVGWEPECFARQLRRSKPGLPDDMLSAGAVLGDLLLPRWGTGDVYARHFARRYFHDHTLAETGPPDLVVNLTDYETGARVALWKGRALPATPGGPAPSRAADNLELARLVAASGAFPVAFQPVHINDVRYVDGGIVENLGVTGLRQYVSATGRRPDVVLISDVGAEPRPLPERYKPSPIQMAVQAPELTSRALHQAIYREYSDGRYRRDGEEPPQQPFTVRRESVWPGTGTGSVAVFVLAPTSPAERGRFAPGEEQRRARKVADLGTLQELEPEEVDAAFWVGAKLARAYVPGLCRALGRTCPEPPAPPLSLAGLSSCPG